MWLSIYNRFLKILLLSQNQYQPSLQSIYKHFYKNVKHLYSMFLYSFIKWVLPIFFFLLVSWEKKNPHFYLHPTDYFWWGWNIFICISSFLITLFLLIFQQLNFIFIFLFLYTLHIWVVNSFSISLVNFYGTFLFHRNVVINYYTLCMHGNVWKTFSYLFLSHPFSRYFLLHRNFFYVDRVIHFVLDGS